MIKSHLLYQLSYGVGLEILRVQRGVIFFFANESGVFLK